MIKEDTFPKKESASLLVLFLSFFLFNLVERPKPQRGGTLRSKVLGAILYKVDARCRAVFSYIMIMRNICEVNKHGKRRL